jgi:hypothetical protein
MEWGRGGRGAGGGTGGVTEGVMVRVRLKYIHSFNRLYIFVYF